MVWYRVRDKIKTTEKLLLHSSHSWRLDTVTGLSLAISVAGFSKDIASANFTVVSVALSLHHKNGSH